MINVKGLYKSFSSGGKVNDVLKNVNFQARPGEIFGLLGPNGAGKTTTLRTISTLLKPDKGKVSVCGFDVTQKSRKVRDIIGLLTSDMKLAVNLTAIGILVFFTSRLYNSEKILNTV